MRRKTGLIIAIILVVFILTGILFAHTLNKAKAPETRQINAELYGYRVDGGIILQDQNGRLWEVPYTDEITANDIIRIEVTGYEVNHVWIEITWMEPETAN